MAELSSEIIAIRQALNIAPDKFPRSVAIIMDGNGRWARQRGLPRTLGHRQGAEIVRDIAREAGRLGLEALTLYSFSIENWKRPEGEVNELMHLYAEYLAHERPTILENNLVLKHLGRRDNLPKEVLHELDETIRQSSTNTGMKLCLALNYGSRLEMVDAVRKIARRATAGEITPDQINEQMIDESLYSAGLPDPDLLIRTAGEMRISNFLLWQISYAELYVTDTFWPDFREPQFHQAIAEYARRQRRFGGLDQSNT
ncbi:MAG: isoprenyl transferase [Planctomycetaceae bacterium]|nr:isoprenyl transferase [Planctomycetaceae bacterium]